MNRLLPIQVPGLSEVDSIAAGNGYISGAVSKSSQIYIWGKDVRSLNAKSLTSPHQITIDDQPKEMVTIDKPVNLILKVMNSSTVQLSWDQPKAQNELEDGYNIYQNNVLIGSTKEKNYVINNLDATKEYNFYITTKDTSGKESEASNTVKREGLRNILTSIILQDSLRTSCLNRVRK
ncbi:fibronectin type III domain-containing protein [Paenibacillus amylolyticus]|nr:fibronectin type III domain-containing protein [Paenibacillus amylolyticus]WFR65136.1 fibronectin type III domain-containing protein [Paenibacillus amylolyticus]